MNRKPYAEIVGVLTVSGSLIVYDGGHYSLDGGNTVSIDTIGPLTELCAPAALTVELQNSAPVTAKRVTVSAGPLTITGPGELVLENNDVAEAGRICGIRVKGAMTVNGGATVRAAGYNNGVHVAGLTDTLTVTANSRLYGIQTGVNATLLGAGKYGVYCGGGIFVSGGALVEGTGPMDSCHSYGIYCDAGHQADTALFVAEGSRVCGRASVGIYTGGPAVVEGGLTGTGGDHRTSCGIEGDRASLTVGPNGSVAGNVGGGGYAGVLITYGCMVNGGTVTGAGGSFGVRGASGKFAVTGGGVLEGGGGDTANSGGVFITGGTLTVNDAVVRGRGGRLGVYAFGGIHNAGGTVEGSAAACGADSGGSYGAVISGGVIEAAGGEIVEKYTGKAFLNESYQIPYGKNGNIADYKNYDWTVSTGAGQVESDPAGSGIRALGPGSGTLTAIRAKSADGEAVALNGASVHRVNIPVELAAGSEPAFTVTYAGNGSTGGNVPTDRENPRQAGDAVTVSGNTGGLVREGYRFAGWSMGAFGGTVRRPGERFAMTGGDVTFYAVWELLPPEQFSVRYDSNGAGSGGVPVDGSNYPAGVAVPVRGNTGGLARHGFRFAGWALDPKGTGVVYQPGNVFLMPEGHVTLFAVWLEEVPCGHRVCYDACRAVCGKVPVDLKVYTPGEDVIIRRNYGGLWRPGFCFIGWALSPGGAVAYRPGEVLSMPEDEVVLFAAWRRVGGTCRW